jgi:hypothetical protein
MSGDPKNKNTMPKVRVTLKTKEDLDYLHSIMNVSYSNLVEVAVALLKGKIQKGREKADK